MIKALVNEKILYAINAESGMIGECPHCGKPVRARCGEINIEHWAHINCECPYITERDTKWHVAWKNKIEKKGYETEKRFGNFISDAFDSKTNTVIEFQHSQITPQEIRNRCDYYKSINKNIKWIFDYTDKYLNNDVKINKKLSNYSNGFYYTFEVRCQKKSYIYGILDDLNKYPNVPIYFNIIFNHNIGNCYPLKIIEEVDIKDVDTDNNNVIEQIFSQRLQKIVSEIKYDKIETVLLKVKTLHEEGKRGSCEILFV